MIGCHQVVKVYSFAKEIKLRIRASYIVFLFVKSKNNNFIEKLKHAHSLVKTSGKFVKILVSDFADLFSNSPKHFEDTENVAMKTQRTWFFFS